MRYLILLLIFVAGCAGKGGQVVESEGVKPVKPAVVTRAELQAFGLEVIAPEGWSFGEAPEEVELICQPEVQHKGLPVMLYQTADVGDSNLQAIVSGFARQIGKGFSETKITRDEKVAVHLKDWEGYLTQIEGTLEGEKVTASYLILHKGQAAVLVTSMEFTRKWEGTRLTFEEGIKRINYIKARRSASESPH